MHEHMSPVIHIEHVCLRPRIRCSGILHLDEDLMIEELRRACLESMAEAS